MLKESSFDLLFKFTLSVFFLKYFLLKLLVRNWTITLIPRTKTFLRCSSLRFNPNRPRWWLLGYSKIKLRTFFFILFEQCSVWIITCSQNLLFLRFFNEQNTFEFPFNFSFDILVRLVEVLGDLSWFLLTLSCFLFSCF